MKSRKLYNKRYVSSGNYLIEKTKVRVLAGSSLILEERVRELENRLQQEQQRSQDKTDHINKILEQKVVLEKCVADHIEINKRNFNWFRIEEEKRLNTERKLEIAKKNEKLLMIAVVAFMLFVSVMNTIS